MGSRGRTSGAEISVISAAGIATVRRPEPPDDLTDEQADEWRAVVNRLPADWFPRETHGMLAQYCRHVIGARRVAEMIQALEAGLAEEIKDPESNQLKVMLSASKAMDRLLKMQEREGRAISSLATRMRISQQASYDKQKKKPLEGRKPWETEKG